MINKRERCALALRAYQQRTGISQTKMAKLFHVGHSTISNLMNACGVVSEKTMEMITVQCEHEQRTNVDNARERIRNFIEDHKPLPYGPYTVEDFARVIGEPVSVIEDFLSDDENVMYRMAIPVINASCKLLGMNYAKIVSPLGPEEYML